MLTFLAVLRAGMIAMPLPLLWRRADITNALSRAGASALIVSGRVGGHDQLDDALQAAVETFHIRFVCGFGQNVPDGVVALSDLFAAETLDPLPPAGGAPLSAGSGRASRRRHLGRRRRRRDPGRAQPRRIGRRRPGGPAREPPPAGCDHPHHLDDGLVRGPRHARCCRGCWSAARLALHHPFDPDTFADQQRAMKRSMRWSCPARWSRQLTEAGALAIGSGLSSVLAVWPAPDRLARAPAWRDTATDMVDIQVFGEIGLIAARRGAGGRAGVVPFGPVAVPRGSKGGVIVGEDPRHRQRHRGHARPHGAALRLPARRRADTDLPQLKVATTGFVDTGFACWSDQGNAPLVVTGPPPGMVSVGGYRFLMRDLQDAIAEVDATATLAALPDAMTGHRLAGSAADLGRHPGGAGRAWRQSAAGQRLPRAPAGDRRRQRHRGGLARP